MAGLIGFVGGECQGPEGQKMGMGKLAVGSTIFKRKFRWGLTLKPKCLGGKGIPEYLVKVAARPSLSIEETEINMMHGKMYIPGKASWETITVTFYDVVGKEVSSDIGSLYGWIIGNYDFTKGIQTGLCMGAAVDNYAATIILTMYSGCGLTLEKWTIKDAWPQAVNWNDLDYSSSEEATIEVTVRYSDVTYDSDCLKGIGGCCEPCK